MEGPAGVGAESEGQSSVVRGVKEGRGGGGKIGWEFSFLTA